MPKRPRDSRGDLGRVAQIRRGVENSIGLNDTYSNNKLRCCCINSY